MPENMDFVPTTEPQQQEAPAQEAPQQTQDGAIALSEYFETSSAAENQPEGGLDEQTQEMDAPQESGNEAPVDYSVRTRENKALRGRYQEDVNRGVEARLEQERARWFDSFRAEAQEWINQQMAPLREAQVEQEAQKLIASKKISDPEMAREFARMRLNLPKETVKPNTAAQTQERPRDEQGRFVSPGQSTPSPDIQARAQMLSAQAQQIQRDYGIDVMAAFRDDPVVRENVGSGKWDFNSAALYISHNHKTAAQPPVVRTPNNNRAKKGFAGMTDDEFERFEASMANGARYDFRR